MVCVPFHVRDHWVAVLYRTPRFTPALDGDVRAALMNGVPYGTSVTCQNSIEGSSLNIA